MANTHEVYRLPRAVWTITLADGARVKEAVLRQVYRPFLVAHVAIMGDVQCGPVRGTAQPTRHLDRSLWWNDGGPITMHAGHAGVARTCGKCNVKATVPVEATGFRCTNCQQMWVFRDCGGCLESETVAEDSVDSWTCASCGYHNGATAKVAVAKVRGATAAVVVAAVLAIIGALLPWITVDTPLGSLSRSGVSWDSGGATIVIVVAAAVALTHVAELLGWHLPGPLRYSALGGGAGIVVLLVNAGSQVNQRNSAVQAVSSAVSVHVGAGVYLAGVAGVAIVIAGVATLGGLAALWANLTTGSVSRIKTFNSD